MSRLLDLANLRKPVLIPMILRVEDLRALEPLVAPICGVLVDTGQQFLLLRLRQGREGASHFYVLLQIFQRLDTANKGTDGQ